MDTSIILAPAPLALIGYTLGLNAIVSLYKRLLRLACERSGPRVRSAIEFVEVFNSQASTLVGALSGPLVVPWLFDVFGAAVATPLLSSIMIGAAAGAMSSTLWDLVHRVIKRLAQRGGADSSGDQGEEGC